jgi:hypothetical protein
LLVDVFYEGLVLARGLNLRVDGGAAFVDLEAPMPVGTRLVLAGSDGARAGRVERVHEGQGAGMLVRFGEALPAQAAPASAPPAAEAPAAELGGPTIQMAAVSFPEPEGEAGEAEKHEPADSDEAREPQAAAPDDEPQAAADEPEKHDEPNGNGKKKRGPGRTRRKTVIGR